MGKINTILFASKVGRPENNRLLRIVREGGQVVIQYRNIRVKLTEKDFRKCVMELAKIPRPVIEMFQCSKEAHAEVLCYLGLRPNMAKTNALTWESRPPDQFVLKYRYLEVALTQKEGTIIETLVARAKPDPRPARFKLKDFLKRITGRQDSQPEPMLHERLSVDLCENIHLHFQNLRFEFSKEEFCHLLDGLSGIDLNRRGEVLHMENLPEPTEWDDRLQVEEQVEGHYHIHYRNLRLEFADFAELGVEIKLDDKYRVDSKFENECSKPQGWKLAGIRTETIASLKAHVYTKTGDELVEIKKSPIYQALISNSPAIYNQYREIVLKYNPGCRYEWAAFQALKAAIERDGYNQNHLIVIKGADKTIVDGQHRASILAYLHGDQHKVKVAHYK